MASPAEDAGAGTPAHAAEVAPATVEAAVVVRVPEGKDRYHPRPRGLCPERLACGRRLGASPPGLIDVEECRARRREESPTAKTPTGTAEG